MKLFQVVHYGVEDGSFGGDYAAVSLEDNEGKTVARFGDYYHDKGFEKSEGFIMGVEWATGTKVTIVRKNIADDLGL